MSPDADPYRTLGLGRGASLEEVKRAYRRLAKANHPDAAGEASLTRFLEIQAAYDRIVGPGIGPDRRDGGPRGGPPRQPWEADPTRANATHRAYGDRGRRTGPAGSASGPRPAPGPRPPRGPRPEPGPPPGPRRPPRPPNKATLGSTSYDGTEAEPFEPDWGGASWYGTTSGTYWTLNPKEYADPRKHGPEYQARARRAAEAALGGREGPAAGAAADPSARADDPAAPPATAATAAPPDGRATAPPPTHTTSSWWEATAGAVGPDAADPRAEASASQGDAAPAAPAPGVAPWAWALLEGDHPGSLARVARAVLGWAPIALGIGWVAGELTGCGRFAAECDPSTSGLVWLAQVALLVVLLALPRVASVAAIAAVAAVAAAVPAAVLITASGGGRTDDAEAAVLGGLVAIAWIGGAAIGVLRTMRRTPRPVS